MLALRILGALVALILIATSVPRYRRRQISRLNLIISWVLAIGIILLAVSPGLFDPVFNFFNFRRGGGERLLGVLLFAVLVLFALLWRAQTYTDSNERAIRQLVEALGVRTIDVDAVRAQLPPQPLLATISPAFNEAENVGFVLDDMPREVLGYQVFSIVVDDCSDDGTADVAREHGALAASLPVRRGGGLALRVGYEIALQLGAEIIVTLDADGQHKPEEMDVMIKPIIDGEADYVNGSRLLGAFEKESTIRHIGVHFFSRVVTILTGQRITDPSSGYRAARADLLHRMVLEQDQFWSTEVLIEALRMHAKVREVPVTFLTRRGGESKKPKSLRYGWNFAKVIVKTWLR
ncbi:MAG: DUF2304 family protein [Actinomycetota bacterium]